jgi:hypothetical protein
MGKAEHSQPSFAAEATGWLTFLLFVAAVYRLRRVLDRTACG